MKTVSKLIFIWILSMLTFCAYAEESSDSITPLVQHKINALMTKYTIPGVAVELYVDGSLHEYYYGYADLETKDPIIRKTIFEIGSISKIMTSLLFAQEIDWAKMALNDPISKYIKGLPDGFNKIKLQDLATHTSGLPVNTPTDITTQDDLRQYLSTISLETNPGGEWKYSNFGMGMLGYALEMSTESEFDDLYRRHVLNPLKMVTGVSIPKNLVKYYAQGYTKNGDVAPHSTAGLFPAAAGVKASAADMQRFLSAAIGLPGTPPRVFYPMRLTESVFVKMGDDFQGLAWQIHPIEKSDIINLLHVSDVSDFGPIDVQEIFTRPIYNGNALIDKTGATPGFRAYIAVIPNKKSGIVLLANKNVPNSAIVKTAREILFNVTKLRT
jgi:beta-lactamase class C